MIYHNDIDEFDNDDAKPPLIVSPRNSALALSEALVLPLFSALPDKKNYDPIYRLILSAKKKKAVSDPGLDLLFERELL